MMTFIAIMVVINFILLCVSLRISNNTADIQTHDMERIKYEIQTTIYEFENKLTERHISRLEQSQATEGRFEKMIFQLEQKLDDIKED